jgi:outer membrane protein OmpA-like peptidoglycan-associated protein
VLPSIAFEPESDVIDAAQDPELRRIASCLTTAPHLRDATIIAIGHTDVVGSERYNLRLGLDRALRVKAFLVEYGIAEDRLVATTMGDLPAATVRPGRRADLVIATGSTSAPP